MIQSNLLIACRSRVGSTPDSQTPALQWLSLIRRQSLALAIATVVELRRKSKSSITHRPNTDPRSVGHRNSSEIEGSAARPKIKSSQRTILCSARPLRYNDLLPSVSQPTSRATEQPGLLNLPTLIDHNPQINNRCRPYGSHCSEANAEYLSASSLVRINSVASSRRIARYPQAPGMPTS